jgi:hypothetical protein
LDPVFVQDDVNEMSAREGCDFQHMGEISAKDRSAAFFAFWRLANSTMQVDKSFQMSIHSDF